jgi:hypothetical protein
LRELFETIYQDRLLLREPILQILGDLDEVWGDQGTYKETAERLDREVLPLLKLAADMPVDPPSNSEMTIAHVVEEWRRIADTLKHP